MIAVEREVLKIKKPGSQTAVSAYPATFAGFDLYIEATDIVEHEDAASFVRLHITPDLMDKVARSQAFCNTGRLKQTTEVMDKSTWDTTANFSSVLVKTWEFLINESGFWIQGKWDKDTVVESDHVSTKMLDEWIRGETSLNCLAHGQWVGGSLVYSENDPKKFTAAILKQCPEVAAKECEINMAAWIDKVAGVSVPKTQISVTHRRQTKL